MSGILKQPGAFAISPQGFSLHSAQDLCPPAQISLPFPLSSVAHHNRLGLFLLSLTKSCDDILEPKLDELIHQLRMMSQNWMSTWIIDQLMTMLSSLSSPDDLFNFFSDIRGIHGGPDSGAIEDDQIILDLNSNLGIFLRRCVLAFNLLSFEGVCHLLTNIGIYCKEEFSNCPLDKAPSLDDSSSNLEMHLEYENMELENFVYEKVSEEIEARKEANERIPFHLHVPNTLVSLVDDIDVSGDLASKHSEKVRVASPYGDPSSNMLRDDDPSGAVFLRTNWQVQGCLQEQADIIEKNGGVVSLNGFEIVLRQLQKLAPELHRVHFLSYLNSLSHDDYIAALENIHCYFDYSYFKASDRGKKA
ncbi:anaphase-promoting complex subunit 5-like [Arachis hypogaea]|uniref:anaphase-promoting complex subunit 5-like n=1 Tax=Arachis hypogaea TaxID=3818 RepID=UPI003B184E58